MPEPTDPGQPGGEQRFPEGLSDSDQELLRAKKEGRLSVVVRRSAEGGSQAGAKQAVEEALPAVHEVVEHATCETIQQSVPKIVSKVADKQTLDLKSYLSGLTPTALVRILQSAGAAGVMSVFLYLVLTNWFGQQHEDTLRQQNLLHEDSVRKWEAIDRNTSHTEEAVKLIRDQAEAQRLAGREDLMLKQATAEALKKIADQLERLKNGKPPLPEDETCPIWGWSLPDVMPRLEHS